MENLHPVQMHILCELLFRPIALFTDLNMDGMTSDHFSYHIRELLKRQFVVKLIKGYTLTDEGKEFANRMDTDTQTMEKQPKVSVVLCPYRVRDGITEYAIHTRLKEPYYGYTGFMTGKVRYGETVVEAAQRELYEEMRLSGTCTPLYVLHEMVYDKTGKMLEDKFFNAVLVHDIVGELLEIFEGGRNKWVTREEFFRLTPRYHNEDEIFLWFEKRDKKFKEKKYFIEGF